MTLTVRERKAAETRFGLLMAAVGFLRERPLDQITVKEICARVPVSQPTFFNYFDGKVDLLVYMVQLWSLEMAWKAARRPADEGPLEAIEAIFVATAERMADHPRLMGEIIAHQVRRTGPPTLRPVTRAERLIAFPDKPGMEHVQAAGFEQLVPPLLAEAVHNGDLPAAIDVSDVAYALAAVFFGVPAIGIGSNPALVERFYRRQLHWLWAGLRASL